MGSWKLFLRRLQCKYSSPRATRRGRPGAERFRPAVLALEDRTVPAADMFADATPLSGALVTDTGSNVGATAEVGELAPLGAAEPVNSVWWRWTSPVTGPVEVNTLGCDLDTVLGVWTGPPDDLLNLVDANDDFYDFQSRVVFDAAAGITYYFSVDGYADATGDIVLNVAAAPDNDNFANAAVVTVGTYTGSNAGATAEPGEPSGAGTSGPVNSVWWQWTAETSELVEFNTFGSELDTLLAVYSGSSVDNLQLITSNDDTDGLQSQVLFDAVAGTTYHIAVDGTLQFTGDIVLTRPAVPSGSNRPPVITPGQTFTLNENSFGGVSVGTVAASDPNRNQTLTYEIIGGNTSNAFSIDRATGEILVDNGAALDYEVNPTFNLTVQVTDDGTPALSNSAVITVNLVNLHDAPKFVDYGPFTVAENGGEGTAVGKLTTTDPDPGQTVTYTITAGNTSGAFAVNAATGEITVANPAALDYETTPVFTLAVTAQDDDTPPLSSSAVVVIFVDDGNEAPTIADQAFATDENSPLGTAVGRVVADDPDGGQALTYSITGGDPAGAFAIDAQTGWITVQAGSQLNFEATPSYVLTVRVDDDGSPGMSASATVTINLNDVNESAVYVYAGPFLADENVAAGTVVGSVVATDPDGGTTLTYAITSGNASGAFAINPSTGEITVANASALDFESHPSFTLSVRVLDDGVPVLGISASVVITLRDVNDAPVLDTTGAMMLAAINQGDVANGGTLVSALLASAGGTRVADQDAGAVQGIAIVAADTAYGSWQYSVNGGSSWLALGTVSNESARLLAADSATRVRFVPVPGYNGTVAGGVTFRAWDQTAGGNGGVADTSVNGGTSAFSAATETASVKVRSALEQIALLSADVRALVSAGELASSDGNQLLSRLNNARKHLEQANPTPAANQMNQFINNVSDLVQAGSLSPASGNDLLTKARAVIVSIWN